MARSRLEPQLVGHRRKRPDFRPLHGHHVVRGLAGGDRGDEHHLALAIRQELRERGLPGRSVADDWRFLKPAIAAWLAVPEAKDHGDFWQTHFGALKDDPYLDGIVLQAYRQRGRPEDGQP